MEWAEIGEQVAAAREDRGWTRQEASEASGVSVSTWADLEKARKTSYRRPTLRQVCAALDWPRNRIAVWAGLEAQGAPADDVEPPNEDPPQSTDINPGAARRFDELDARLDRIEAALAGLAAQRAPPRPRSRR